ncbi:16S rRNA (uracil1498-N3)-methyltransferase [Aurantimicrobium minutum]|uniref:16S rRNA (uracil(1498)-N(3))-methyltransferase n=1 Tax=Aurantimicrobium minutum TaxID=708131 RepID=UPI002476AA7A|nr:16S rRNA (uracil(1498)-N(3))-methyltransferase [Aurantimicrobium minutum]MDH6532891.1 16S rRNA (uracil1498-N3)-methyltransferase [Aurantimicrobium minutum]
MAHFYLLETLEVTTPGSLVTLDGAEGRHASTVSRVRVGESLLVGNGRGLTLSGTVTDTSKDIVILKVDSVDHASQSSPQITLVQALAKTDRDERAIEASTELGVDVVLAWAAERSVSKWEGPKIEKGLARWTAIVREATKQSVRPFLPVVESHVTTAQVCTRLAGCNLLVLDPTGDVSLGSLEIDERDIALIVGPEGGISPAEISRFREAGATIVTMGANILRTSTAGPAALAILNAKLGRC